MRWAVGIIAIGCIVRFLCVYDRPVTAVNDESAHWNYVEYVRANGALPTEMREFYETKDVPELHSYENYQQPLYYAAMSVLSFGNLFTARMWSIAIFAISALILYSLSESIWLVAGWSLLPSPIIFTSMVSNDLFIILGAALATLAIVKGRYGMLALAVGILALSKLQGLVVAVPLCVYMLYAKRYKEATFAVLVVVSAALIALGRHDMLFVNSSFTPNAAALWTLPFVIVGTSAITGIAWPEFVVIGSGSVDTAMIAALPLVAVVLYGFIRFAYARLSAAPMSLLSICALCFVVVWMGFSLTHGHWQGRLLYPSIFFLSGVKA